MPDWVARALHLAGAPLLSELSVGTLNGRFACPIAGSLTDPSTAGSRRSVTCLPRPDRGVITIDLQPGYAQPRHAMGLDRALPGGELLDRQFVAAAGFLKTNGAATDGVDDHRLTPRHPAFGVRRRQVDHCAADPRQDLVFSPIIQRSVLVHARRVNQKVLKNSYCEHSADCRFP